MGDTIVVPQGYHVNMPDLNDHRRWSPREAELNLALEALYYGFNAIIARPDRLLARRGLSRVHHRVLYFIARHSGVPVNDLLMLLGVTKQSLNAPLRKLLAAGFVRADPDERDRRIKRLSLTAAGRRLEQALSGDQRARFASVFAQLGASDEAAWRRVMTKLALDAGAVHVSKR